MAENECKICFDRGADTLLLPCKHNEICADCMIMVMIKKMDLKSSATCPFCRRNVKGIQVKVPNVSWCYFDTSNISHFMFVIDCIYSSSLERKILRSFSSIYDQINVIVEESIKRKDPLEKLLYFQQIRNYIQLYYVPLVNITLHRPELITLIMTYVESVTKRKRLLT